MSFEDAMKAKWKDVIPAFFKKKPNVYVSPYAGIRRHSWSLPDSDGGLSGLGLAGLQQAPLGLYHGLQAQQSLQAQSLYHYQQQCYVISASALYLGGA